MSNRRIASRITEIVAAYERGQVCASAIEESLDLHGPALEAIPRAVHDEMHRLSVEIIEDDLNPLEEAQAGLKADGAALTRLKTLLQTIE